MAKICVITFTNTTDNYGQVLQYLATQEYLKARGHQSYLLISKGHKKSISVKIKNKIKKYFHKPQKPELTEIEKKKEQIYGQWWQVANAMEAAYPRYFEEFRQKNFNIISSYLEEIANQNFDAYAVGSDQTWGNSDELYYLSWAPKNAKRFAIAPSVAHYQFSNIEIGRLRPSINLFDFITVREENGLSLCKRVGYQNAQQILDPTFLISSSIYDRFIDKKTEEDKHPYIFLYLLGSEISVSVQQIFDYAKENGLIVKYVVSQGRDDNYPKEYAQIGEWLALIKNAKYVITNSFHGMAFSIIYHKHFLTIPIVGVFSGMNVRVDNIAKIFGLQEQIYNGNLESMKNDINWGKVDQVILNNISKMDQLMKTIQY